MRDGNDVMCFRYMGRSKFEEIIRSMKAGPFVNTHERIYLYGSSGFGKSHMLAALAFKLICDEKQVVYIPDCGNLVWDLENALREALSFAFYNSPLAQDIQSARTVEDLCNFWHGQQGQYLLVDQLNALENHHEGNKILDVLNGMGLSQRIRKSNNIQRLTLETKQHCNCLFLRWNG
jgi:ABC-type phosphate/phosphonate transport system ATPase subunit